MKGKLIYFVIVAFLVIGAFMIVGVDAKNNKGNHRGHEIGKHYGHITCNSINGPNCNEQGNCHHDKHDDNACTSIDDGIIAYPAGHYLAGDLITSETDIFGYNYQAHTFDGYEANSLLGNKGFPPYEGDLAAYLLENPGASGLVTQYNKDNTMNLAWNDAWLSNQDCDNDGLLDKHYGFTTYQGSGAWETINGSRIYTNSDLETCYVAYFQKFAAVPSDAVCSSPITEAGLCSGVWSTADGTIIGPSVDSPGIGAGLAMVERTLDDSCAITGLKASSMNVETQNILPGPIDPI
jgi:hypothetical protein